MLYHVEADAGTGKYDVYILKEQVGRLYGEEEERTGKSRWEGMLWRIWEDKQPDDGLCWEDEYVRQAVYYEIRSYYDTVPSREAIRKLSDLHIMGAERVNTFHDLEKLPQLTSLKLTGTGGGVFHCDLTQDSVPALETLFLENIPLEESETLRSLEVSLDVKEGCTPIENVETRNMISVDGSPWQDVGRLAIAFWWERGSRYEIEGEELDGMQPYLERYYPEKEIVVEDFVKGDLNNDGIEDMAITGVSIAGEGEEGGNFRERYVYPLIGKEDGSFIPLTPIESLEQGTKDPYDDRYEGIILMDNVLAVQVSGGGNWRWGNNWRTGNFNIYQYEEGKMKEKWEVNLQQYAFTTGMVLTIDDKENNQWKQYAVAENTEKCKELLLIAEDKGVEDSQEEEFAVILEQFEEEIQKPVPEVFAGTMTPERDSLYDYRICDYAVARSPDWVLQKAAEEFLTKALSLPAACYASEEVKDSYEKLIGVELPDQFYIGLMKEEPVLLYYNGCMQKNEHFVHELVLGIADEKGELWRRDCRIYYDESEGIFLWCD